MTPIATPAPADNDKAKPLLTGKFTAVEDFYVAGKYYPAGAEAELTKDQAKRLGDLAKPV